MSELSTDDQPQQQLSVARPAGDDLESTSSGLLEDVGDELDEDDHEEHEPTLDARHLNLVHEELEKLNIATDVINKLELQLDAQRARFRDIQSSWSERLKELNAKYGPSIQRARQYYEAKIQERALRDELQRAAQLFERNNSLHAVAKEQVALSQASLARGQGPAQPECLEVLNHHIQRVNEAEQQRADAEGAHRAVASKMALLAEKIAKLEKSERSAIKKSRHYYDQRLEFTRLLEQQKALILKLEQEVRQKKADYTASLRRLENISDSIHEERSLGGRSTASGVSRKPQDGVGPPPYQPTAPPPYDDEDARRIREEEEASQRFRIAGDEEVAGQVDDASVLSLIEAEGQQLQQQQQQNANNRHSGGNFSSSAAGGSNSGSGSTLGSGVLLLAQQLMRSGSDHHPNHKTLVSSSPINFTSRMGSSEDVRYQTSLPSGVVSSSEDNFPESDRSSLASSSATTARDDDHHHHQHHDFGSQMLRSHSQLIQEIESGVERVTQLLGGSGHHRSVSDACAADSGVESIMTRN